MLILAIGCVLVGFACLVISLVTENSSWAWGCIAACVAAAAVLFVDARSRRSARSVTSPGGDGAPVPVGDPVAAAEPPTEVPAPEAVVAEMLSVPEARKEQPSTVLTVVPALAEPSVEPLILDAASTTPGHTPEPPARLAAGLVAGAASSRSASGPAHDETSAPGTGAEPDAEDVAAADAVVVAELEHDVLVVDEHPRFHVQACTWLIGRETMNLPAREAVELGFTPCSRCAPARTLASLARA